MKLFGRELNREAFYQRFADPSQVGGVRRYTLNSGKQKGIDAYEVNTGAGLRFTVLADRCMDIAWADFQGVPIAFISKAGISSSVFFEHRCEELHRVFGPGLLTTCGLRNVGRPCVVDGEVFAQHGRIHNAPAEGVSVREAWAGDEYTIQLEGEMREAVLYNENLRLRRTIETSLGSTRFVLTDHIENLGAREEQVCALYHFNFGYPLVDEGARAVLPSGRIANAPLDDRPERWSDELGRLSAPLDASPGGFRVAFDDEQVRVGIENPALDRLKGTYLRYSRAQLPCFSLWRNLTKGDYVVGLEPSTTYTEGRARALEQDALVRLPPMDSYEIRIEFGVETGEEAES